ncbi:MAG: hypothetical protein AB1488_00830 [Nitrospirota bacterium]
MIRFKFVVPITIIGILLFSGYSECSEKRSSSIEQRISDLELKIYKINLEMSDLKFKIEMLIRKSVVLDPSSLKHYERIDTSSGFFLISLEDVTPYLDGYKLILSIGNPSSATYAGFTLRVKWGKRYYDSGEYLKWKELLAKDKELTNRRDEVFNKYMDELQKKRMSSAKKLWEEYEKIGKEQKALYPELRPDLLYAKWWKSLQEKEVPFTEELKPASWNKIELIISPAKAEQIGYLVLSMDTEVVRLFGR